MLSRTGMSASSSSQAESAALCPHFGSCGGCQLQDRDYDAQVKLKEERVSSILEAAGAPRPSVHPSPQAWYYRNKMEFSFGDVYPPLPGGPTVKLGLKPKGRWYEILDLADCRLLSPETPGLLAAVRSWAQGNALPPFNSHRHSGLLRHLVVREAKNAPERMVILVTSPGAIPKESFLEAVLSAYPATTLLWGKNGKISDTAVSDSLEVLSGPGFITESLRLPGVELKFRISPHSFFQTNTRGAEVLYGLLRSWLKEAAASKVLDLYCGGGGIALSVAGVCREVAGVELNASAIEDARANAALNLIENVKFYSGAVETLLPSLLDMSPDVAVADPPRAGLHSKVLEALRELGPANLFYVSCNPESLERDLAVLKDRYGVRRSAVVDLFPHTEHVETLVWLTRL